MPRDWTDPKPNYNKKLNIVHFEERVPCPYCKPDAPTYPSNLALARHVLREHNWNKNPPTVYVGPLTSEEEKEAREQETP